MASSIAAATVALFDALVASAALAGVQIIFGPPATAEEQEVIAIMGISDADEEFAALGAGRMEETYSIELKVKVYDPADTEDSAATGSTFLRAEEIREAIRTAVATNNRTLGGTVRIAQMGAKSYTWGNVEGGGRVLFIDCPVNCRHRIV